MIYPDLSVWPLYPQRSPQLLLVSIVIKLTQCTFNSCTQIIYESISPPRNPTGAWLPAPYSNLEPDQSAHHFIPLKLSVAVFRVSKLAKHAAGHWHFSLIFKTLLDFFTALLFCCIWLWVKSRPLITQGSCATHPCQWQFLGCQQHWPVPGDLKLYWKWQVWQAFYFKMNLTRQTFHAQWFGVQVFEMNRQRYKWMMNFLYLICSLIKMFYQFCVRPLCCIPSALITRAGP